MIEDIKKEIDKKYKEYDKPINKQNRCKWSIENETVEVSKARRNGFLSGLLVSKSIVEKYKDIDKYKNAWSNLKKHSFNNDYYNTLFVELIQGIEKEHNISKGME